MKTKLKFFVASIILFASLNTNAQIITVIGKVTSDNKPVDKVVVKVLGTKDSTFTDIMGEYIINAKKGDTILFEKEHRQTAVIVSKSIHDVNLNTQSTIRIRGNASSSVSAPVFIVDGKVTSDPQSALQGKVADIEVLKDDAATAIYGSRAANGVVIINTEKEKKRKPGKPNNIAQESQVVHGYSVVRPVIPVLQEDNEEYDRRSENGFKSAAEEPLSTFSADVDKASYSNVRRFINKGVIPDKDAVRIEEFINYFDYDYPKPSSDVPVTLNVDSDNCPWNKDHKLVRIGLKAREVAADNLPACNFVFLIDVSGSMYGPTRLDLVKSSLNLLINNLRDKDKVAIVVYAGAAGEVLPSTSGADKQKIRTALQNLTAGGSTAGGQGIVLAYQIAEQNLIPQGNNRIILCTDGDFNVGVTDNKKLEDLISEKRKTGVALTILGYGMGNYKDNKMQTLAEKGNGNHAYIDDMQEANNVLVSQFSGTLYTVAKDVKLQVEFNPAKVSSYRLVGYESRLLQNEDFNDDAKDAGDMGAGHTVTALYEIIPVGVKGNNPRAVDDLKYQKNQTEKKVFTNSPEMLTAKMRYKDPESDKSKKIETVYVEKNGKSSGDLRFAAAAAMFAQLLKDSPFKGDANYDKVIELANGALDNDQKGYRREFVRLVETVKGMSQK